MKSIDLPYIQVEIVYTDAIVDETWEDNRYLQVTLFNKTIIEVHDKHEVRKFSHLDEDETKYLDQHNLEQYPLLIEKIQKLSNHLEKSKTLGMGLNIVKSGKNELKNLRRLKSTYDKWLLCNDHVNEIVLDRSIRHNFIEQAKRWENVEIIFVSDESVKISLPNEKPKRYTFSELGFKDKRKGDRPNQLWGFFRAMAVNRGIIPEKTPGLLDFKNRRKTEKQIQRMRKTLKDFFQIDENPIKWHKKGQIGYKTVFELKYEIPDPDKRNQNDISTYEKYHDPLDQSKFEKERTQLK